MFGIVISIYPGFLNLRLYDRLFEESVIEVDEEQFSDPKELIVETDPLQDLLRFYISTKQEKSQQF